MSREHPERQSINFYTQIKKQQPKSSLRMALEFSTAELLLLFVSLTLIQDKVIPCVYVCVCLCVSERERDRTRPVGMIGTIYLKSSWNYNPLFPLIN